MVNGAGAGETFLIATVLLERNRWTPPCAPSLRVSEWVARFRGAGFDGMELWQNHAAACDARELAALETSGFPVAVFSAYAGFDDAGAKARGEVAALVARLRAPAVKFNLGPDPGRRAEYLRNLAHWRTLLPPGTRLLCECHAGTIMETPASAASVFDELACDDFGAIVHPFTQDADSLARWMDSLGPRVAHAHVQARDDGSAACAGLATQTARVRENLAVLARAGFAGSFSIEFTAGVGVAPEDADALFRSAAADLGILRGQWHAAKTEDHP